MKSRAVAIVLLVVAAVAFVTWLCLQDNADTPAPAGTEPVRSGTKENATPQRTEDASSSSADPAARTDASAQGQGSAPEAANKPFTLSGTFVVVDERGIEHTREDGTFDLGLWEGNTSVLATVNLQAGSWELAVETMPQRVTVHGAQIGGRAVLPDARGTIEEKDPPFALRGHWFTPLTLRVVADDTGADLTSVRIVQVVGWESLVHPGNVGHATVVVESASSPVRFTSPGIGGKQKYRVRAPGYAWGAIDMDPTDAAERLLRLLPAGDIELTFTGGVPPAGSVVRLRDVAGGMPVADLTPKRDGPTRVDGLRAGDYTVKLEK